MTSQRSQGHSKVGAHGYDAAGARKDAAPTSKDLLSAPTPPAMRKTRQNGSSSKSVQDNYDYINLDRTASVNTAGTTSANTTGTAASVAFGGDVAVTRRDHSEPPYAGRTTNSSVDDDVEDVTSSMSAIGKSDARSDDVYLDVTRNSQSSEAPDSVNDVSMTTDVTKQDDNENVYFKDNDAYQP